MTWSIARMVRAAGGAPARTLMVCSPLPAAPTCDSCRAAPAAARVLLDDNRGDDPCPRLCGPCLRTAARAIDAAAASAPSEPTPISPCE